MSTEIKPSVVDPVGVTTHYEVNNRQIFDDSDLVSRQAILQIIANEPEMPGSPFDELPFWTAVRVTLYLLTHPYENARIVVRGTKKNLRAAILGYKNPE